MNFEILGATPDDGSDIIELLPRLGAFPRPEHRSRDEIHQSDARVIQKWIDGGEPDCMIVIAREDGARRALQGFALVRMQPDALNGEPSAHLEALAVADGAEGKGVGSALIERAEQIAFEGGAATMTLHVFQTNQRAVALYERRGYSAEWVRYIKPLRGG
jgi:ribosomal protein S18 acetylase RimI-like enzyme